MQITNTGSGSFISYAGALGGATHASLGTSSVPYGTAPTETLSICGRTPDASIRAVEETNSVVNAHADHHLSIRTRNYHTKQRAFQDLRPVNSNGKSVRRVAKASGTLLPIEKASEPRFVKFLPKLELRGMEPLGRVPTSLRHKKFKRRLFCVVKGSS